MSAWPLEKWCACCGELAVPGEHPVADCYVRLALANLAPDGTDRMGVCTTWAAFNAGELEPTDIGHPGSPAYGTFGRLRRAYYTEHNGRWPIVFLESRFVDRATAEADLRALRAAIGDAHWADADWLAAREGGVADVDENHRTVYVPW